MRKYCMMSGGEIVELAIERRGYVQYLGLQVRYDIYELIELQQL